MGGERLKIRDDVLKIVTSKEAERVSRYTSLIFLRLVRAPHELWYGEDVLRLSGELREGRPISAQEQLISLVKVSPRTMRKVIAWLKSKSVIDFYTSDDRGEIVITFIGLNRGSGR